MADYRELLRRAIDVLPENTGANRRAVYEKARGALVAQLRAIDPPLPAREITQHRLNLEDCIRQVEQEATDKLLGRFRGEDVEQDEGDAGGAPPSLETAVETGVSAPDADSADSDEPLAREPEEAREAASVPAPEPDLMPEAEPEPEPEPETLAGSEGGDATEYDTDPDDRMPLDPEPGSAGEDAGVEVPPAPSRRAAAARTEPRAAALEVRPATVSAAGADAASQYSPLIGGGTRASGPVPGSIEDIIAAAEAARSEEAGETGAGETGAGLSNGHAASPDFTPDTDGSPDLEAAIAPDGGMAELPARAEKTGKARGRGLFAALPFGGARRPAGPILTPGPTEPTAASGGGATLVDVHGQPLSRKDDAPVGEAMSSVREVELDSAPAPENDLSDPQVAIDRAIEALDREARGEGEADETGGAETPETDDGAAPARPRKAEPRLAEDEADERGGGFGALTVFLVIAVLLMVGGGAAGFWAWREGYVDLDAVFAQGDPAPEVTQTAELEPAPETLPPPETDPEPAVPDTALDEPVDPAGSVAGEAMPGEALPFVEPEPAPSPATEDRLPSEDDAALPAVSGDGEDAVAPDTTVVAGPQSLLLEEQPNGAAGAVPYSGSVTWTRGTDEVGNPTIEATASIPARNLSVDVLLRRNADGTLPASHLMEINFTVSETFVGGTVASLPGILLKNDELVQGQPLTGASARIVGNSFLFALSSASPRDVETNVELLDTRGWLDIAMVYGTGRRAILTLEKGEDGEAIFNEVLAVWAELDGGSDAAADESEADDEADADEAPA